MERADVFVQNLAPGAAERLGLGAQALRERQPRLVWCGISGYGPSGPYAGKKAYDLLVQCETGVLSVTGTEEAPSKAGIPVADIAAGMYAFSSILAALLRRERTGEGATLDITMFEALGEWMGFPAYFTAYGGTAPPRTGAHHATIAPYGPFRAGDGFQCNLIHIQGERPTTRGPVLLVHGAGVRANIFRAPVKTTLVDTLVERGYDVWLENWRASIDLPPNRWTLDQAAVYDHPVAVKTVLRETGATEMKAVIHCQGSTSFMMRSSKSSPPERLSTSW